MWKKRREIEEISHSVATQAKAFLAAIDERQFDEFVIRWFSLVRAGRTSPEINLSASQQRCAFDLLERHFYEVAVAAVGLWDPPAIFNEAYNSGVLPSDDVRVQEAYLNEKLKTRKERMPTIIGEIQSELFASENPWNYLKTLATQPAVLKNIIGIFRRRFNCRRHNPLRIEGMSNFITEPHMNILRGLVWMCGIACRPEYVRALPALALSAYHKSSGKAFRRRPDTLYYPQQSLFTRCRHKVLTRRFRGRLTNFTLHKIAIGSNVTDQLSVSRGKLLPKFVCLGGRAAVPGYPPLRGIGKKEARRLGMVGYQPASSWGGKGFFIR